MILWREGNVITRPPHNVKRVRRGARYIYLPAQYLCALLKKKESVCYKEKGKMKKRTSIKALNGKSGELRIAMVNGENIKELFKIRKNEEGWWNTTSGAQFDTIKEAIEYAGLVVMGL